MTIFKKLLMSAPILALALASSGVSAGHHEKGEKGEEVADKMADKMSDEMDLPAAETKLKPSEMTMDEAEVKAKIEKAEREANMQKLHDEEDDSKMEEKPE